MGRSSQAARDWALKREARKIMSPEIVWDTDAVYPLPQIPTEEFERLAPPASDTPDDEPPELPGTPAQPAE